MYITKDFLLKHAYELYLQDGYSKVSISVLHNKLKIGRASLYYYFKTKDDLFKAVLDEYVFKAIRNGFEDVQTIANQSTMTVPILIRSLIKVFHQIEDSILMYNNNTSMANLTELLLFAYTEYADIAQFLKIANRKIFRLWIKALQNEQNAGTIRNDIDVMVLAGFFCSIKSAYESGTQQYRKNLSHSQAVAYENSLNCLYELIKTKQHEQRKNNIA